MSTLSTLRILPERSARRRGKRKRPTWQQWLDSVMAWMAAQRKARTTRRLRLCETVSFGEKRFAAVLEFESRRFLVGGTANSVTLLADLSDASFAAALAAREVHVEEP